MAPEKQVAIPCCACGKSKRLRLLSVIEGHYMGCGFLLTVGNFLLTMELFYLQLTSLAFFTYNFSFFAYTFSFLLTVGAFCLQWESPSNKRLKGL